MYAILRESHLLLYDLALSESLIEPVGVVLISVNSTILKLQEENEEFAGTLRRKYFFTVMNMENESESITMSCLSSQMRDRYLFWSI
jgi:hypothetical protein